MHTGPESGFLINQHIKLSVLFLLHHVWRFLRWYKIKLVCRRLCPGLLMRQMLLRAVRASKSGGQFTERRTDKQSCGSLPRVKGSSTKAVEHVGGNDSYGNLIPFYGVWRDELCHISYYSRDRKRQRGPGKLFCSSKDAKPSGGFYI